MKPVLVNAITELLQGAVWSAVVPVALATSLTVLLFAVQWLVMALRRND